MNDSYTKSVLFENILDKHFVETEKLEKGSSSEKNIIKKLNEILYMCDGPFSKNEFCQLFEEFDLKERQANFIDHAVRGGDEFYGYRWATPEFDKVQFDTWLSIVPELRVNRKVFFEFENYTYPEKFANIRFAGINKSIFRRIDLFTNLVKTNGRNMEN